MTNLNFINKSYKALIVLFCLLCVSSFGEPLSSQSDSTGYIIDQPGTITFTSGVKIKGKVEKPQVVIFMTKEKALSRPMDFNYSFKDDIMEPISFTPLLENTNK